MSGPSASPRRRIVVVSGLPTSVSLSSEREMVRRLADAPRIEIRETGRTPAGTPTGCLRGRTAASPGRTFRTPTGSTPTGPPRPGRNPGFTVAEDSPTTQVPLEDRTPRCPLPDAAASLLVCICPSVYGVNSSRRGGVRSIVEDQMTEARDRALRSAGPAQSTSPARRARTRRGGPEIPTRFDRPAAPETASARTGSGTRRSIPARCAAVATSHTAS